MKRDFSLLIALVILLTACGRIKVDVPDTTAARITKSIVEQWITANRNYDAEAILSLYSDDITWIDHGYDEGPYQKASIAGSLRQWYSSRLLKVDAQSYLVTLDGRFAVIQAIYSEKDSLSGKWVSTPATAILEFKAGKILNETWYYNTGPFYHAAP